MTAPAWLDASAWPFAARTFAHADGALHYIDEGAGPPVVLVHGTPTWSFEWRHVIAALAPSHRVLAMDHLGFGRSARPATASYTPESHARRFRDFMRAQQFAEPVTLVVHDFGGPIGLDWALDLARENPERLARVVVVNSWMWAFTDDPVMASRARMVDNVLGRWLYRYANASLRLLMPAACGNRRLLDPRVHANYRAVFPDPDSRERVLYALARALTHSAPFFATLWERRDALARVPLHIIWGMADSAFPPAILDRWQSAFPHATVDRLDGVGHWPHEEAPAEFVQRLLPCISALTTPQRPEP